MLIQLLQDVLDLGGASWPRRSRAGRVRSLGRVTRAPRRGGLAGLGIGTCRLCGLPTCLRSSEKSRYFLHRLGGGTRFKQELDYEMTIWFDETWMRPTLPFAREDPG